MKKLLYLFFAVFVSISFLVSACAPGQIKKKTGYNPASKKLKHKKKKGSFY